MADLRSLDLLDYDEFEFMYSRLIKQLEDEKAAIEKLRNQR